MAHSSKRTFATLLTFALFATPVGAIEPPAFEPDPCPDGDAVLAAQTPADLSLQRRVETALSTVQLDRMTDVRVVAIGSTVCLRGRAANPSDFNRAEATAAEVRGVAQVENRLRIPLAD